MELKLSKWYTVSDEAGVLTEIMKTPGGAVLRTTTKFQNGMGLPTSISESMVYIPAGSFKFAGNGKVEIASAITGGPFN